MVHLGHGSVRLDRDPSLATKNKASRIVVLYTIRGVCNRSHGLWID